jgi:hypothetical protein
VATTLALALAGSTASAQCESKLTAPDGEAGDHFGISFDASGESIIIGTAGDGIDGAAYLMRYDGSSWFHEANLIIEDGGNGTIVCVSDDSAVVFADRPGHTDPCDYGSLQFFRNDGIAWGMESFDWGTHQIVSPSVAISADVFVYGYDCFYVPLPPGEWPSPGHAIIYRNHGPDWIVEQELSVDQAVTSVDVDGETIVIGVSGAAYVHGDDGTAWNLDTQLLPLDGEAESRGFGLSVAISGETVVVGASHDDERGPNAGAAYVYRLIGGTWAQTQKLVAADGTANDRFGDWVDVDHHLLIVGAPFDQEQPPHSGSAYVYRFNGTTWSEVEKLVPSDGAPGDGFGRPVSISGGRAVIGATGDDDLGSGSGSVYAFDLNECLCLADTDGDGDVAIADLLNVLISFFVGCPPPPPFGCGDVNADGAVTIDDLLIVLMNWGPCP